MADDLTITLAGGDWLAVILATLAAFFIGFIWFTFLFGKQWAAEFNMEMGGEGGSFKAMAPSMLKDLVGNFLMAYVLFHTIVVWLPSLWGAHFGVEAADSPLWQYGMYAAAFSWLGFFVPVALSRTGWEQRSWRWFGIDVGYHLVKLIAMAQIMAAMTTLA